MAVKRDRIGRLLDAWQAEHPEEPFIPGLERASNNLATELRSEPAKKIRSLLAECEQRKAVLERELPHLMRVYQPFSMRREDWEYALCDALIPHLRLEIDRRGSKGSQSNKAIRTEGEGFTHSEDYRSVSLHGHRYTLTSQQAQMIQILDQAREDGNPDVSIANILEKLEKSSGRWQDTFKGNLEAKKALIRTGERKGTLRLNL